VFFALFYAVFSTGALEKATSMRVRRFAEPNWLAIALKISLPEADS
jgi:hypothetical protein